MRTEVPTWLLLIYLPIWMALRLLADPDILWSCDGAASTR